MKSYESSHVIKSYGEVRVNNTHTHRLCCHGNQARLQTLFNFHKYTQEKYDCQTSPSDILVGSIGENVNLKEISSKYYGMPLQYGNKGEFLGNFSSILDECPWWPWHLLLVLLINHVQNGGAIHLHIHAAENQYCRTNIWMKWKIKLFFQFLGGYWWLPWQRLYT